MLHPLTQPTDELASECWRKEQELFCYQWKFTSLLRDMREAFYMLNPGIVPNSTQWIINHLADVPDSEGRDYICLNYRYFANSRCEQLLQ
jgi:hypothetical protein